MTQTTELVVIREKERYRKTKVSRVHWWREEQAGKVPKRIRLGPNSVGWLLHEIDAHLARLAAERDEEEAEPP